MFDSPHKVITSSLTNITDFRDTRSETKWFPTTEHYTKINFDATIDASNHKMGIGLLARNWKGEVMLPICLGLNFCGSSALAESYALTKATEICLEFNLQNC